MKHGRRLTAVGLLTGGLLLVGFAGPSLADVGTPDGTAGTTTVSSVTPPETGTASDEDAKQDAEHEAEQDDTGAVPENVEATDQGATGDLRAASLVTPLADDPCDATPLPVDCPLPPLGCPPGQTDHNGDLPGCGEAPEEECPPNETDHNGGDPGCGEPPVEDCPLGETDYNGDDPGCGVDPDACPPGQVDFNGEAPGCGNPVEECPAGQSDTNGPLPGGCTPNNNGGNNGNVGNNGNGGNNGGNGAEAGGLGGSNQSGSEGIVPGAVRGAGSPGTSACGDVAVCSTIQGVDASTTTTAPAAAPATGGLPETGAPASTQSLMVLGFGLVALGVVLVRPRRLARHRA